MTLPFLGSEPALMAALAQRCLIDKLCWQQVYVRRVVGLVTREAVDLGGAIAESRVGSAHRVPFNRVICV